jgi:hypothetical protein
VKIRIYGASDDCIEVEGCEGADEFNSYEKGPVMWRGDLVAPNGRAAMRVYALYDGCWSFAFGQISEDQPFAPWPVYIGQREDTAYSVEAQVDAWDGTVLQNVWPTRDDD